MTEAAELHRFPRGIVLAVDGGGVKTDLAIMRRDGALLALVRGGRSSPHYIGVDGCVRLLAELLARALAEAGLGDLRPPAEVAEIMVAGADLPEELAELRTAIGAMGWGETVEVDNDTFALLRSGSDRGWGVAVVCGGGINCVALAPDGTQARFPALGRITGDWGGGYDVGGAALAAAARSADGRGPKTVLEAEVPGYFGLAAPFDLARAIHLGELPIERLGELTRVVFPAAAGGDEAAEAIVERLADEVVTMATTALRRLNLAGEQPDVVLGGGLMRAAPSSAIAEIAAGIRTVAPGARVVLAPSAPIVGAALLGFDRLDVSQEVLRRARAELDAAFVSLEGDGSRVTASGQVVGALRFHGQWRSASG